MDGRTRSGVRREKTLGKARASPCATTECGRCPSSPRNAQICVGTDDVRRPRRDYRSQATTARGGTSSSTAECGRCRFGPRNAQASIESNDLREHCRNDGRNVDDATRASAIGTNTRAYTSAATDSKCHENTTNTATATARRTTDVCGEPAKAISICTITGGTIAGFGGRIRMWNIPNARSRRQFAMAFAEILQREPCFNSEFWSRSGMTNA